MSDLEFSVGDTVWVNGDEPATIIKVDPDDVCYPYEVEFEDQYRIEWVSDYLVERVTVVEREMRGSDLVTVEAHYTIGELFDEMTEGQRCHMMNKLYKEGYRSPRMDHSVKEWDILEDACTFWKREAINRGYEE